MKFSPPFSTGPHSPFFSRPFSPEFLIFRFHRQRATFAFPFALEFQSPLSPFFCLLRCAVLAPVKTSLAFRKGPPNGTASTFTHRFHPPAARFQGAGSSIDRSFPFLEWDFFHLVGKNDLSIYPLAPASLSPSRPPGPTSLLPATPLLAFASPDPLLLPPSPLHSLRNLSFSHPTTVPPFHLPASSFVSVPCTPSPVPPRPRAAPPPSPSANFLPTFRTPSPKVYFYHASPPHTHYPTLALPSPPPLFQSPPQAPTLSPS